MQLNVLSYVALDSSCNTAPS